MYQGKVPNGSIFDRDNQVSFSLIITDNQAFAPLLYPPFRHTTKTSFRIPQWLTEAQYHRRTQSLLTRRPPHPAGLTGVLKQKLPTLTWLCQCMKRTKQSTACDISVRHVSCTVSWCVFVVRYQNTSNLENHYVTVGTDHKELADRLTVMHHIDM